MNRQQAIKVGQLEIRYLVDGAQRGGLGLFELTIPAGAHVPPPHSHTDNEECVYVLEGVVRYTVDDETRDLAPGDWMSTPRGSVHAFSNPGSTTARAAYIMQRRKVIARGSSWPAISSSGWACRTSSARAGPRSTRRPRGGRRTRFSRTPR